MSAVAISAAIELLLSLLAQASRISALLRTARAEGRESLTKEEWNELLAEGDTSRARLVDAIARAEAEGR